MGICEGPITGIGNVWTTSTVPVLLSSLGLSLAAGATPQSTWSYLTSNFPSQAISYPGVAYVYSSNYDLGNSASIGDTNLEVKGVLYGSGPNGVDADPALVIQDFLTNSQYGAGFPSSSIDATALLGGSGSSSYRAYCWASGIAISPILNSQETAGTILARWLQLTNSTAVWSAGLLRIIPYGDGAVTANGWTYTPNLSPIYSLTDEDFVHTDGEDPVKITRSDPFSSYNQQSIEIQARSDSYGTGPIVAFDQSAINRFGLRPGSSVTAHEICDLAIAQTVVQLILQRGLYIRNTYQFKLSMEFCLLDPMDLLAITDPLLGLSATVVRITDIEEDSSGLLTVTAEEFPQGTATAVAYPVQAKSNGAPSSNAAPAAVNTPIILEPPPALSGGTTQLWIGVSGSGADPTWGSCIVWASLDGTSYTQIQRIVLPARQGVLLTSLPTYSGANPDSTDTLAVDLTMSGGILQSVSSISAASGVTLCYCDGEYLSYTTATLTAVNKYSLTGLYRGSGGLLPSAHLSGTQFCVLDTAILKYDVPTADIGQTIWLKFQSVNIFGGGVQDLSTCTAYSHIILGTGITGAVTQTLSTGTPMDYGSVTSTLSESDDFGTVADVVATYIDLGSVTS
jgi:hypothetical protein